MDKSRWSEQDKACSINQRPHAEEKENKRFILYLVSEVRSHLLGSRALVHLVAALEDKEWDNKCPS